MPDPVWFSVIADLLIDLSAGWLAAAAVMVVKYRATQPMNWALLTINVAIGIFALVMAFELRKEVII